MGDVRMRLASGGGDAGRTTTVGAPGIRGQLDDDDSSNDSSDRVRQELVFGELCRALYRDAGTSPLGEGTSCQARKRLWFSVHRDRSARG